MKPMSRKIPSSDPRIAFKTSPAGPSFSIALEANPIAQSETGFRLTLGSVLTRHITNDVLFLRKLVAQASAIGMSGEVADLVDLREILTACCIEEVSGQATLHGESHLGPAGGHPTGRGAGEAGARSSDRKSPGPSSGEVDKVATTERQHVRALIPEPMLLIRTVQSRYRTTFKMESMAEFEECFSGRHYSLLVGYGAAHVYPISVSRVESRAGQKLRRVLTKTLIHVRAKNGGPALVPTRAQADALGFGRVCITEEIGVIPDPEFVPSVSVRICQTCSGSAALRIDLESLPIFRARSGRVAQQG